jgi:hypothetical protein
MDPVRIVPGRVIRSLLRGSSGHYFQGRRLRELHRLERHSAGRFSLISDIYQQLLISRAQAVAANQNVIGSKFETNCVGI